MSELTTIYDANRIYASAHPPAPSKLPARHLAIVTCMDARIDVSTALGLSLGDVHIIRNAGGRVSDDALRSLTLSCHALGTTQVLVMHHTKCGLAGGSNDELRDQTGASFDFLPITDADAAIRTDVDRIATADYLTPVVEVSGGIFDVDTGVVREIVRWNR